MEKLADLETPYSTWVVLEVAGPGLGAFRACMAELMGCNSSRDLLPLPT